MYAKFTSDGSAVKDTTVDSRRIKWEDNSLTFEITYLDTTGPLTFVYNSIAPEDDKQLWTAARKSVTIANEMGNTTHGKLQ